MITTLGEIMIRLTPQESGEQILQTNSFRIEPGGSESNVAIALSNLGMKTQFITSLPDNTLSDKIVRYLNEHNVRTYITTKGSRLGIYWTENGIGPRNSFVIYDRTDSAFCQSVFKDFNWKEIFENSDWFHFSGISPAVSKSVCVLLENVIEVCQCPYSVDLNYRKKLWEWLDKKQDRINKIMSGLCAKAHLIAGNETDFTDIFGMKSSSKDKIGKYTDIAEQAFERFPKTKYLAISNRASISATNNEWTGFLFINQGKQIYRYEGLTYKIDNIIDRVGTGDSFVAGIIFGIVNNISRGYQYILDYAVTLSALNHITR